MMDPKLISWIYWKIILGNLLEFPPMSFQNFGYAIWHNKYKEKNIITQLLAEFYAPNVPPPSTHNQNFGNSCTSDLQKNIRYTSHGSTPELPYQY
jgi:hypothetical protein